MPEKQNHNFAASTNWATMITIFNGVHFAAVEGDEDQFDRLPDALVVVIFNKLFGDVASLFRCFSVSKRFASLVLQTDTMFIPIPCPKNQPILVRFQNLVSTAAAPLRFLLNCIVPTAWQPPSSSSYSSINHGPQRAISKLPKFTALRSLVIEFCSSDDYDGGLWFRHKSVIGARLEILVAIFASALHKNPHTVDDDSARITHDGNRVMQLQVKNTRRCLDAALLKHRMAQGLIHRLPALCELVISERITDGKMCMGKEQIVEVRNSRAQLSPSKVIGGARGVKVQKWRSPVLELPLCGCLMENATVVVVRREDDEEIVMQRDLGFILGAFGYEDHDGKVVDEVVNVVRQKMVTDDNDGAASINACRLEFIEDHEVFSIETLGLHHWFLV